ncbi:hypothetical protein LJC45_00095 [Alistipes sp. OttesenSCG-928-B03]|nr:hypothetical protein [Alistipes sp. OttesenSCG-928-B03]
MKIFSRILLLAAVISVAGCAQKEELSRNEIEQRTFDLWIEKNHPQAERHENGMWYEWLSRGTRAGAAKPAEGNFLMIEYTGRTLDGNIITHRSKEIAEAENTYTLKTRYTPHYLLYSPYQTAISKGEMDALAMMAEGDEIRIYMPAMLGYRDVSNFTYGYEGWYNSSNNTNVKSVAGIPIIVDLKLVEVVTDPEARELAEVEAVAKEWGATEDDKIEDGIYMKYVDRGTSDDKIGEDSTFYMTYTQRFLDGFLLSTNDPDIALAELDDWVASNYTPTQYNASYGTSILTPSAIQEVFKTGEIYYGSTIKIVTTSDWAYMLSGLPLSQTSSYTYAGPVVFPYTPLVFEIKIYEWGYDPDPDDEEEEEE